MSYQFRRRAIAGAVAAVVATIALASHVPPPNTVVTYSGTLPFDTNVNGAINSSGQDGYDFYCVNLTAGQQLNVSANSTNGLFPNLILLRSVAAPGAAYSTISATQVAEVDNPSAQNVNLAFTPTSSGIYTIVISTFTGQSGTYALSGSGFAPLPGGCPAGVTPPPVAANIPVPATDVLTLSGMALALAGIGAFLSRRQRRR
jgi:hypothetical protein